MLFRIEQNTLFLTDDISAGRGVFDTEDIKEVTDKRMDQLCEQFPEDVSVFDQKEDKSIPPLSIIMRSVRDPRTNQLVQEEVPNNVALQYDPAEKDEGPKQGENPDAPEDKTSEEKGAVDTKAQDPAQPPENQSNSDPLHPMEYDDVTLPEMKQHLTVIKVDFSKLEENVQDTKSKFYPFYKENCAK